MLHMFNDDYACIILKNGRLNTCLVYMGTGISVKLSFFF